MLKVGILPGDDIGLEVVPEAVKVMKAATAKTGLQLEWRPLPIGRKSHEACGHTMPRSTVDEVATLDGWLMGPIGHSLYPRNDPTWAKPDFRKRFDLFASVKPVKSYGNIESLHKGVDIVFLREVTEGLQNSGVVVAGNGEFRPNDEISIGMRVVTRKGANRVARAAFEIARTRFDTIVLDPPAFAKNKAALQGAVAGYKEINLRAIKLLNPGGHLITCSCSYNVDEAMFAETVLAASADAHVPVAVVEKRMQGRDHPVLLGVPETYYLKCFVMRRLD